MDAIAVGIDVSAERLDVAVLPNGESFSVGRDPAGIAELLARVVALAPGWVGLEATGGLEQVVAAALGGAGLPVVVLNPAQVRAFAHALGQRAKSDAIDALVIARFLVATRPALRPLPDEATQRLAELVGRRRQIIEMMVAERQRERQLTAKRLKRGAARLLAALQKELSVLEAEIGDAVRGTPAWREKEDLLASVPGIGPTIARTLIAEMPELGSLSGRQAAALAGLAPWTRQSGKWKGRSLIGGGRASLRAALYMGALVAARHNPLLRTFYERLRAAGKARLVALVAVARKLLTILNAILRSGTPWRHGEAPASS